MGAEEEAQQTPAVDDAAVAETAASEHAAPRKGPMKRYQKPDIQELKAQINSLEATISQQKQRQQAIRSELDGRKRRSNDLESQGIRNQLQELRTQFQQVLAQKQAVRAELDSASKAREALRMQVRGMKGKMEYTTVEKIDEQMARLEQRLQHTSMPLTEEKKVLDDIKKLRASRAGVAQYAEKLERLSGSDDCGVIVERLRALDEQLSGIKAQEEGLRKQLSDIRAKDEARNVDIPKIQQERDDAREVIRLSVEKIKQLRAEHREKQEQWWQGEQAWREQRARDKARRDEEYTSMRAERDKERKARQAELAGDPFNKEITLCEQVQGYLSSYLENDKPAAAAEKAEITPLQGMSVFQKKKVEDDNPYATLEKKSKKGRKAEKSAAKPPSEKPLNHSLDLLGAFAKLKIEAPYSVSKVPAAVDAVKERRAYYLKKQEEAKADPEKGTEAEAEGDNSDKPAAAPKAVPAAATPFVGRGDDEPTPAEAASGRAAAGDTAQAQNSGVGAAQGAWATPNSAPEPADAAAPAASGGDVSLGLTHGDDGSISVSLTVGGEGR